MQCAYDKAECPAPAVETQIRTIYYVYQVLLQKKNKDDLRNGGTK